MPSEEEHPNPRTEPSQTEGQIKFGTLAWGDLKVAPRQKASPWQQFLDWLDEVGNRRVDEDNI